MYVSVSQEPSTYPALEALESKGIRILLPKLGPGLARMWAWYEGHDNLVEDAPGRPPAPAGQPLDSTAVEAADVVIVPALAIDPSGNRVGQGGGWYDRMLKQDVNHARIGAMVYPWEMVSMTLPSDGMDVPVKQVILPDQIRPL